MCQTIVVYGCSGHGKVVADVALCAGFRLAAFIDDELGKLGSNVFDVPVVAWDEIVLPSRLRESAVALGIGDNSRREACFARLMAARIPIATLVHPSAVVARSARLGAGTVLMAHAVVNPDATVGEGCILNTGAIVEHDNVVGKFVHLSPNVALGGDVAIGDRTHLGLGAVVLPGIRVGSDARVGAGAAVHRPVPDGWTVVGVPARRLFPSGSR